MFPVRICLAGLSACCFYQELQLNGGCIIYGKYTTAIMEECLLTDFHDKTQTNQLHKDGVYLYVHEVRSFGASGRKCHCGIALGLSMISTDDTLSVDLESS
jgi:hypothetical protein